MNERATNLVEYLEELEISLHLTPRELVDVARTIECTLHWNTRRRAAALASVLATDTESQERILRALLAKQGEASTGTNEADVGQQGREKPKALQSVVLYGGVFLLIAVIILIIAPVPPQENSTKSVDASEAYSTLSIKFTNIKLLPPKTPSTELVEDIVEAAECTDQKLEGPIYKGAARLYLPRAAQMTPGWQARLWVVAGFTCILFGLISFTLPLQHRRRIRRQRRESLCKRRSLAARDDGEGVFYHPPVPRWFPKAEVDDAAKVLSKLTDDSHVFTLNVEETLNSAVRGAGYISPVFEATKSHRWIIALVDRENGQHPFLPMIDWLLEQWRATGLRIIQVNYFCRPDHGIFLNDRSAQLTFNELADAYQSSVMMVFSRLRLAHDLQNTRELPWLELLQSWQERLLVDLDPRPLSERSHTERRRIEACILSGLPCASLSESGPLLVHRLLSSAPYRGGAFSLPPLQRCEQAVRLWAASVALIPEASWSIVEDLRFTLRLAIYEQTGQDLATYHYVVRLIEWIQNESRTASATEPTGAALFIEPSVRRQLVDVLRSDQRYAVVERLARTRHLVYLRRATALAQLSEFESQFVKFKIAAENSWLEPKKLGNLIALCEVSPMRYELAPVVREVLRSEKYLPRAALRAARTYLHWRSRVQLSALLRRAPPLGFIAVFLPIAVGGALLLSYVSWVYLDVPLSLSSPVELHESPELTLYCRKH